MQCSLRCGAHVRSLHVARALVLVTLVARLICLGIVRVHNSGDLDACLPVTREFEGFDVISCFNVIDRCSTPITLLKQIKARLRDQNSRVILATPLPLNPSVEIGKQWVAPAERIAPKVRKVAALIRALLTALC